MCHKKPYFRHSFRLRNSAQILILLAALVTSRFHAFANEPTQRTYAQLAAYVMADCGRDLRPVIRRLDRITNQYQYEALEILLQRKTSKGQDYSISDNLDYILQFDNNLQVLALRLMVDAGRDVLPSMPSIVKVTRDDEIEMLRWLLERSVVGPSYRIADKWPMILGIKNEFAKSALSEMIKHGRKLVEESCRRIPEISLETQVEALKILLEENYFIAPHWTVILSIQNPAQLAALRLMVKNRRLINPSAAYITQVSSDLQLNAIEKVVSARRGPQLRFSEGGRVWILFPRKYRVASHFSAILKIQNDFQLEALSAVVDRGLDSSILLERISEIRSRDQVDAIKMLAESSGSVWATLLNRPTPLKTHFGTAIDCPAKIKELVRKKK